MYKHCPHGRRLGARIMGEGRGGRMQEVLGFPRKKLEDLRAIFAATFRLAFVGSRCFCKSMPKGSKTGAKKQQIFVLGRTTHLPTRIWRVCDQVRTLPPTEQFHAHCLWSRADMAEAIREMDCCWDFFFFQPAELPTVPSPPKFWKLPLFFLRNYPIGRTAI